MSKVKRVGTSKRELDICAPNSNIITSRADAPIGLKICIRVENKLKPDFTHYITNQIMKPVQQVLALVLEDIPEYRKNKMQLRRKINGIKRKYKDDVAKQIQYEQKHRNDEVKKLIFDDSLRQCLNMKNNQRSIKAFFGV